ncbi:MAG: hypothetical protein PT956_05365 [Firmicutes bacterium]|nr:hypothetical protein [Bacillota bacterium]
MAQSWNRLINERNIIKEHDLVLLRHERLEHHYMNDLDMTYEEAHNETNKRFHYIVPKKED